MRINGAMREAVYALFACSLCEVQQKKSIERYVVAHQDRFLATEFVHQESLNPTDSHFWRHR